MKMCSKCQIFKNEDRFSKDSRKRDGLQSNCKDCVNAYQREYAKTEHRKKMKAIYNLNFKKSEKGKATEKKYRENERTKNRLSEKRKTEEYKEYVKDYYYKRYSSDPDFRRAFALRAKRYRERYPHKANSAVAARRSQREKATPVWADKEKIDAFYKTADGLRMLTGEWWEVDHIVPLRSKFVCGLHSHTNLQILMRKLNQKKSNKLWPEMPDISKDG